MANWEIKQGDVLEVLRSMAAGSVHMVVTSPPYWGLRDYGIAPQTWGGDPACEHEWSELPTVKRGHPGYQRTLVGTQTATLSKSANSQGPFCPCDAWLEVWPESHWPGFTLRQSDVFQSYAAQ